jgi:hypothetical protein
MINARWHEAHPMPRPATLDQRLRWHKAHAAACGCRDLTPALKAEFTRRGWAIPKRRAGSGRVGAAAAWGIAGSRSRRTDAGVTSRKKR